MPCREPLGKRTSILKPDTHDRCPGIPLRKLLRDPMIRLHKRAFAALVIEKELVFRAGHIPGIDLAIVINALEPTQATNDAHVRGDATTLLVGRLQIGDEALLR